MNMDLTAVIPFVTQKYNALYRYLLQKVKPVHFYHIGIVILFYGFLAAPLSIIEIRTSIILIIFGPILLSIGFCWEAFIKAKEFFKENIFSSFVLGLPSGVIVSALSIVVAEQLISHVTQLNPDHFSNSLRLLSALSTPFILTYLIGIALSVYYFSMMIIMALKVPLHLISSMLFQAHDKYSVNFHTIMRAIAAMCLSLQISLAFTAINNNNLQVVKKSAFYVIVLSDFYNNGPCTNVRPAELFAFLDGNEIAVVSNANNMYFEVRQCLKNGREQVKN